MKDPEFEEVKSDVQALLINALDYYEECGLAGTMGESARAKDYIKLLADDRIRPCRNCCLPFVAHNEEDVVCSKEQCQNAFKLGEFLNDALNLTWEGWEEKSDE